jgi:hypothetical protein
MSDLSSVIERLALENPRIYVGRERIYPPRPGLPPSDQALAKLEQALANPSKSRSAVRIVDGEQVVFQCNARGEVAVPLAQTLAQPLMTQPTPEAPPIPAPTPDPIHLTPANQQAYATTLTAVAEQNLTQFRDQVTQPTWKAWASQELPKLATRAQAFLGQKGGQLAHWLKEQAPALLTAVVTARVSRGASLKAWAASQLPQVEQELKTTAQQVGQGIASTGKEIAGVAWAALPTGGASEAAIEQAGQEMIALYGANGHYAGDTFNFYQHPQQGLQIQLKDGRPVFANGRIQPGVAAQHLRRLRAMPQHLDQVKRELSQRLSPPEQTQAKQPQQPDPGAER